MSAKKQAVVDTATRLFSQFGYQTVGVDRIISESGVSKMTLYKYFPSKNDLIVEVLKQREAAVAQDLVAFVNRHDDPLARVAAVFEWHDQWIKGESFHGCMFINATTEHPQLDSGVPQVSAEQKTHLRTFFEQLLIPLMKRRDAISCASKLMILLDGAIIAAQVYGNRNAAMEAWDVAKTLLFQVEPTCRPETSGGAG